MRVFVFLGALAALLGGCSRPEEAPPAVEAQVMKQKGGAADAKGAAPGPNGGVAVPAPPPGISPVAPGGQ